jgi:predicted TPR repeat methyltransferase
MAMGFSNVYDDSKRAEAYSKLEFPGTYYLAYRDLPKIIFEHVKGRRAIDFGCGAGRSTRFLRKLGFDVVGVDISEDMIRKARELDREGDYRLTENDDFSRFEENAYDLVLSVLRLIIYLRWKTRSEYSGSFDACLKMKEE